MNFFEHQAQAKRTSALLIALFFLALVALIAITTILFAAITSLSRGQGFSLLNMPGLLGWDTIVGTALTIFAIIALATLFKLRQLAGGGQAVAEALGGRKINLSPHSPQEQRALNVVEEMAIASGTPVPDVYVIDDLAINAFAAGHKPADAVIGLTRGSIEQLTRSELQGVVAHEFSHIFNGDMRLNLRIVGLLHGILIIGMTGIWLMRGAGYSRRRRGAGLFGIGAALAVIGYTGTFFGNLIKSAISRQREYLADASAVQFTRDHSGIAGALKKIGGHSNGARLSASNAGEFSHMYFADSASKTLTSLLSTHPPLSRRIHRLDPSWNGAFIPASTASASAPDSASPEPARSSAQTHASLSSTQEHRIATATPLGDVIATVNNSIATPGDNQVALAHAILEELSPALKSAAHDPFSARALIYALLLHPDHRQAQVDLLVSSAHPATMREFKRLEPHLETMPDNGRLALLDLCVPALKALAPQQYQIFKRNMIKLLRCDGKIEVWEWALYRVLIHAIEGGREPQRLSQHKHRERDAQRFLLAALAHAGSGEYLSAKRAYESGLKMLALEITPLPAAVDMTLQRLDKALVITCGIAPLKKPRLLKALATVLAHDNFIQAEEIELLRAIADTLDCPMPVVPSSAPLANHRPKRATAGAC